MGKTIRNSFHKVQCAYAPLELIHLDIYESLSVKALCGASYIITFINDFTYYNNADLISSK